MGPVTGRCRVGYSVTRLGLALAVGLVQSGQTTAAGTPGADQPKITGKVKSMTSTQYLSADLVPLIADPAINMLSVRLVRLDGNMIVQDGLEVQIGPARFDIVDVIHGRGFVPGQTIEVPVSQILDPQTRVKNGANQWNNLSLQRGAALVLACPAAPKGAPCMARGGISIDAGNVGVVDALRQCYAVETKKNLAEHERRQVIGPLVAAALQSRQPLLFAYALDFLGRRSALGRDAGASLLARAIEHPNTMPASRYEIAAHIAMQTSLFEPARKTDHANIDIVSSFAAGLVAEPDPDKKLAWIRLLAGTLLSELAPRQSEADALRKALVHGIKKPTAAQVAEALQNVLQGAGGSDRAIVTELQALWR